VAASEICGRLNCELPAGLEVLEVEEAPRATLQAPPRLVTYEVAFPGGELPPDGFHQFERQLLAPLRQKSKRGETLIPLRDRVSRLEALDSSRFRFSLIQGRDGNIRVRDLLMHVFKLSAERVRNSRVMKISSEPIEG
jgi:hypothetical protein